MCPSLDMSHERTFYLFITVWQKPRLCCVLWWIPARRLICLCFFFAKSNLLCFFIRNTRQTSWEIKVYRKTLATQQHECCLICIPHGPYRLCVLQTWFDLKVFINMYIYTTALTTFYTAELTGFKLALLSIFAIVNQLPL